MAIEHLSAVLHGLFGVDPSVKFVMTILADHARRGDALAWPSVPTLARLACLQDRQVQTILHKLREDGWLSIAQASKGGPGQTTVYRLNIPRLNDARRQHEAAKARASAVTNGAADRTVKVVDNSAQTVQSDPRNGAVKRGNGAVEGGVTVQPTAPEPVLTVINTTGFEPDRVPAHATATPDERPTPSLRKLTPEPERQRRQGEMTADEISERKRLLLKQVDDLAKAKAVGQR